MSNYRLDYNEPENERDNPHDVSLEHLDEIIYGGKPSALPMVTWDELSAELQTGLRQLVEGRHIDSDLEDALEVLGLAEYVEYAHAVWATDAGRAILPMDAVTIERALGEASLEAHAETLGKMQALEAENARLRAALEDIAHCPVSSGEHGYMVMLYEARRALGIPTPYDNLTDDDIGEDGF